MSVRRRKTKLVPRSCADGENENSVEMKMLLKDEGFSDTRHDNMATMAAPIEFQVKVEVEAFDENTVTKKTKLKDDIDLPTDKSEVESTLINREEPIDHATEKIDGNSKDKGSPKRQWLTSRVRKQANNTQFLKRVKVRKDLDVSKTTRCVRQCEIIEETVFTELDKLANKELNVADKTLLVAARNTWGRISFKPHCETKQESKFQLAINNWKSWAALSSIRDTPLMYKCYICTKAWWRLHPFAEHLKMHEEDNFSCYIETQFHECNLIACLGDKTAPIDIPIETNCWKCGNDYAFHNDTAELTKSLGLSYKCEYCNEKFFTCTAIKSHTGYCLEYRKFLRSNNTDKRELELYECHICKLILNDRGNLQKHYVNFHQVQSDLPILVPVKVCMYCNQYHIMNNFHSCSKKKPNQLCTNCQKRFPSVLMKNLHLSMNREDVRCRVCKQLLPSKCMEVNHLVCHSRTFKLLYKCVQCEDNLFLIDIASMKNHKELWLSLGHDKRKHFSEAVIVPRKCISSNMVENKSSVTLPGATFKVITKTHREVITKTEILSLNANSEYSKEISANSKKGNASAKENSKDSVTNDSDNRGEFKVIQNEIDKITFTDIGEVPCKQEQVTSESSVAVIDNTKKCSENTKKRNENTKKRSANTQKYVDTTKIHGKITVENNDSASKGVKIKIEMNDDPEVCDDHNYAVDVKQEIDFECTKTNVNQPIKQESMSYEDLLSKVFGSSQHFATTTATIIKEEPIDEEIFEDDIIMLSENSFSTSDVKPEVEDKISLLSSEGNINGEIEDLDNTKKSNQYFADILVEDSETDQSDDDSEEVSRKTKAERSVEAIPQPSTSKSTAKRFKEKCNRCHLTATNKLYLEHLSHCLNPYRCTKCDQNFKSLDAYVWHFQTHGYKANCCPECIMCYSTTALLISHIKMHIKDSYRKESVLNSNEKKRKMKVDIKYICTLCNEVVDVELLFAHWEGHIALNPSLNNIVVKEEEDDREAVVGSLDKGVVKDIKKILLLNKEHFTNMNKLCTVCDRVMYRKNDYKRHLIEHLLTDAMSRHSIYSALKCQFCGYNMHKTLSFREHMRNHACLPVYRCEKCLKSFSDSSNFAKHKKTHNFAGTLQCDVCKKKFHSKVMLIKHIEIHESTEPIVCKCCSKTFYEASSYRRHQRNVHYYKSNARFPCPLCKNKYHASVKDKWEHMWEVHKQRKSEADCPICHKSFRKFLDVKNHIRCDHNRDVSLLRSSIFKSLFGSGKRQKIPLKEEADELMVVFEND